MICKPCIHKRCETISTGVRGGYVVWKCAVKDIVFGITTDWRAGKNMPVKCDKLNKGEVK